MNDWYKNAVIYGVDVKLYKDTDGNGFGDFRGLIERLNHIASLGCTCIWLMPFYPSPLRDYGYDVMDYYNVDPRLGNLGDFTEFIDTAKGMGIRVIIDLVVNHTSIEHPWFKESKKDKTSKYRNYYVWTDEKPEEDEEKVLFEGVENSIWEYSEETDAYYLHRYYKEQADLNISNKEVQGEILKIMGFWLRLGVCGFRIDAAHVITDTTDVAHTNYGNLHQFFAKMREYTASINPEAVLLGEADVKAEEITKYFGDDSRIHMLFNFWTNQYAFLGFARKNALAVAKGLELIKDIQVGHWVNFIRHHDELNLDLLDKQEKQETFDAFAPEENMRVFNDQGIRREIVSMFGNDLGRVRMAYSLIFSFPGSILLSYGDEIGMGDDLSKEERLSVRIPMPWNDTKNAGFSKADHLYQDALHEGDYSYHKVNVDQQIADPASLLNWMKRLIAVRRQCTEIGTGRWSLVMANDDRVFSIRYIEGDKTLVIINNLHHEPLTISIFTDFIPKRMQDIFTDATYATPENFDNLLINGYGYRWIRIYDKETIQLINE